MKAIALLLATVTATVTLSGCARDLSSSMYTSSSTLSFTLEGTVVSARPIKLKEHDKLEDHKTGMAIGALAGGAAGAGAIGGGTGRIGGGIAGALVGGLVGAAVESGLSQAAGMEYIVKVDTSSIKDTYYEGNAALRNVIATARVNGLVTVVQGADNPLVAGQKAFVIFSDNRTRVVAG